jgi:ribosomal protein S18 acetylase RimI-like enzyme
MSQQSSIIRIVPFSPSHGPAWKRLNEAWITRFFALESKDREVLEDPAGKILEKGGMIFMAEKDGEPVGCSALLKMADGGFELAKMAVDERAQGAGIGRKLIDACIAAARDAGAHRLYLESNSSLAPALSLYRSAGFVDLPARPTPYARCDVWMELKLR